MHLDEREGNEENFWAYGFDTNLENKMEEFDEKIFDRIYHTCFYFYDGPGHLKCRWYKIKDGPRAEHANHTGCGTRGNRRHREEEIQKVRTLLGTKRKRAAAFQLQRLFSCKQFFPSVFQPNRSRSIIENGSSWEFPGEMKEYNFRL